MKELFQHPGQLEVTLLRLVHEVAERHPGLENLCVIGIQPRGIYLSRRIHALLEKLAPEAPLPYGEIDATFHRDDFRRKASPLLPNRTRVDFILEGRDVLLVDDVLYTGRTVRAALDAMLAFGRPQSVELLVLVDRKRFRDLPIEANYLGVAVDTLASENVLVEFSETAGADSVRIARKGA